MDSLNILFHPCALRGYGNEAYRLFTPIPQPAAENAVAVPLQPHAMSADFGHHVADMTTGCSSRFINTLRRQDESPNQHAYDAG